MGYDNRFTGVITITPPLTRKQIHEAAPENFKDIRFRIIEQQVESDDGETVTVRTTADAIVPLDMEYSGYNLEEEIQAIVDMFGDHGFAGFIEAKWDAGFDEPPSRFIVKDDRIMRIDAQYRWPGIWPDEPAEHAVPPPKRMHADELAALLTDMAARIPAGDSFGGYINYEVADGAAHEFDVEGAYRIGNTTGQAELRVIRGEESES